MEIKTREKKLEIEVGKYYITKCGVVGRAVGTPNKEKYKTYYIVTDIPTEVKDIYVKSREPWVRWNITGASTNSGADDKLYTVVSEVDIEKYPEYTL